MKHLKLHSSPPLPVTPLTHSLMPTVDTERESIWNQVTVKSQAWFNTKWEQRSVKVTACWTSVICSQCEKHVPRSICSPSGGSGIIFSPQIRTLCCTSQWFCASVGQPNHRNSNHFISTTHYGPNALQHWWVHKIRCGKEQSTNTSWLCTVGNLHH